MTVSLLPPGGGKAEQVNVPLSENADDYQVSTDLIQSPGDWKVSVVIHRTGMEDAILQQPWAVLPLATAAVSRPTLISNRPLAPVLTVASVLLSALCAGVWLLVSLRPDLFQWGKDKSTVLQRK